jgi:Transposase zinc-binding domain
MPATSKPKLYNLRHPERTLLYQTVAEHYETWLELACAGQFDGQGDHHCPKPYVRKAFEKYLECGIFAHGFARARCADCGHDFLVAFSCKGRGVCPSCNTWRMAETAAHLTDHVFPRLPVRQWVLRRPNRRRTSRSISASVGKGRGGNSGFVRRCGAGLRVAPPKTVQTDKT